MSMHLRQIGYFIEVVEQSSIGKAARALNLTQPALSKSLRQLEDEMGASLFDRTADGVRLTPSGKRFLLHARRIHVEFKNAKQELDELRGVHRGTINVGAIPVVARSVLPRAIAQLTSAHPGVLVSVSEM